MAAEIVAGLGSLAGGYVASLILGQPAPMEPDTSIPGIKSATLRKATKGQPGLYAAQIDPTQSNELLQAGASTAAGWYNAAAEQSSKFLLQGYNTAMGLQVGAAGIYDTALKESVRAINNGYSKSNAQLQGQGGAGMAALNEQLKMLGINPISATATYGNTLNSIGDFPQLQQQLQQAEAITDPTQRAAAKQQVLDGVNQQMQALKGGTQTIATEQQLEQLQNFSNDYNQNYLPDYEKAYSADQVQSKLEATPGYQFQLNQGVQALTRAKSATGNLMSGGTGTALMDYGQGLASNYYNTYMQNLQSAAQEGLPANQQIAQNMTNQAGNVAALYSQAGAATAQQLSNMGTNAQQTYTNIANTYGSALTNTGSAYNTSYTNQANNLYNASVFNATAQNQVMAQEKNNQAAAQQQAIASGPGYLNASVNQQQMNYSVFQNQQAGAAYLNAVNNSK